MGITLSSSGEILQSRSFPAELEHHYLLTRLLPLRLRDAPGPKQPHWVTVKLTFDRIAVLALNFNTPNQLLPTEKVEANPFWKAKSSRPPPGGCRPALATGEPLAPAAPAGSAGRGGRGVGGAAGLARCPPPRCRAWRKQPAGTLLTL